LLVGPKPYNLPDCPDAAKESDERITTSTSEKLPKIAASANEYFQTSYRLRKAQNVKI